MYVPISDRSDRSIYYFNHSNVTQYKQSEFMGLQHSFARFRTVITAACPRSVQFRTQFLYPGEFSSNSLWYLGVNFGENPSDRWQVNDSALDGLAEKLPLLKSIQFEGCQNVTWVFSHLPLLPPYSIYIVVVRAQPIIGTFTYPEKFPKNRTFLITQFKLALI